MAENSPLDIQVEAFCDLYLAIGDMEMDRGPLAMGNIGNWIGSSDEVRRMGIRLALFDASRVGGVVKNYPLESGRSVT